MAKQKVVCFYGDLETEDPQELYAHFDRVHDLELVKGVGWCKRRPKPAPVVKK